MPLGNVLVRKAEEKDIDEIHTLLSEAFAFYRRDYTKEAYDATVVAKEEIGRRIERQDMVILIAQLQDAVVGTAALKIVADEFYIQSMAVKPGVQRKGVGMSILRAIEDYAKEMHARALFLECSEPLTKAIRLYEKFGFERTGKERPYHGITVFEMRKEYSVCEN